MDLPETSLWWTAHQQQNTSEVPHQPTTWFNNPHHTHGDPPLHYNNSNNFNLNNQNENNDEEEEEEVENDNDDENNNNSVTTTTAHLEDEKEPMFEKPLTPSDVGKLNRLVIPKQHAEKYFPLGGHGVSGECKGLLLSFEDESGKCWRFRYSYWNSSQSYVLTKGWSRYVKDKRLDAGDVVLFERHRVESQRLFINWRRRRTSGTDPAQVSRDVKSGDNRYIKNEVGGVGVGVGWTTRGGFYSAHPSYPAHHQLFPYQQQDSLHAGRGSQPEGERQRTKPVGKSCSSSSSSSSRVLRLFGVNMECQPEHDHDSGGGPSTPQCSSYDSNNMPSTQGVTTDTHHLYHYHQPSSNPHPHLLRHQQYYY